MSEDLSVLLELARHAASLAAVVHRAAIEKGNLQVQTKASTADLVTEIDRQAEQEMVAAIQAARPMMKLSAKKAQTFVATPVCVGFLTRWMGPPTLYIAIRLIQWRLALKSMANG